VSDVDPYLGIMIEARRPALEEMPPFYHGYVTRMEGTDLFDALDQNTKQTLRTLDTVRADRSLLRYAAGKWSLREVVQHLTDCERIMAYRALCFARGEQASLLGFDEDAYVANADTDRRPWAELTTEWRTVRAGTMDLFQSFTDGMLVRWGTANGGRVTVRALGWIIAGHTSHHLTVINERYL